MSTIQPTSTQTVTSTHGAAPSHVAPFHRSSVEKLIANKEVRDFPYGNRDVPGTVLDIRSTNSATA
jgi:hypothetical protein